MNKLIAVLIGVVIFVFLSYAVFQGNGEADTFRKNKSNEAQSNEKLSLGQVRVQESTNKSEIEIEDIGNTTNNYSSELEELLLRKNKSSRKDFIRDKVATLTKESLNQVLYEYRNNSDERSEKRIISSAILSEINKDGLIDIFYEEVATDKTLLPDFVSATSYTNSQNSFDKLMKLQELGFDEQTTSDLVRGTLTMYQNNVTKKSLSHIENWLANNSYTREGQEKVIVNLLLQAPANGAEIVINNNLLKFSQTAQETLSNYLDNLSRRE